MSNAGTGDRRSSHQAWSTEEVLELFSRHGPEALAIARTVVGWAGRHASVQIMEGHGPTHGTMTVAADAGDGTPVGLLLLYAYPDGGHPLVELRTRTLRSTPPYDRGDARERLVAGLRGLAIPRIDDQAILEGAWPGIPVAELTSDKLAGLLSILCRWVEDVGAHRSLPPPRASS